MQCRGRLGLDAPLTHQEIKSYALVWHVLWSDVGGINGLEHSIGRALPPSLSLLTTMYVSSCYYVHMPSY
jgi:hypothetical protein